MGRDNTSTISFSVKTQLEPFFLSLEGLEVVLAFHNVTRMKPRESAKRTSHVRSVSVLVPPEAETLAALLPVALGNFPGIRPLAPVRQCSCRVSEGLYRHGFRVD
jgi:hypothetical protein